MGRGIPVARDVYQMIAHRVATSCQGALVYAKTGATEDDMNEIYEVRGSAVEFKLRTLDLSVSVSGLKLVCNSLCEHLSGLVRKRDHVRTDATTRQPEASHN